MHTIKTNPGVNAAREARKATGYDLRQAQGRLWPQLSVSGDVGKQWVDKPQGLSPANNRRWRTRRQTVLTVRQILFDGWNRANDIYKNAARIDASALRVYGTSETRGLNAVEAFIDVRRHGHLLTIGQTNVARHQKILNLVNARQKGGKAPKSEVDQARERLISAKAAVAAIRQAYLEARAKFLKVVGLTPQRLDPVMYPGGLPRTLSNAVDLGRRHNPTLQAAVADADAAKYEMEQSTSEYFPELSLEGAATYGRNIAGTPKRNNDLTGKIVLNWDLFNGFITTNKYRALSARYQEALLKRTQRDRDVVEAIERSWAAYLVGAQRVRLFRSQVDANRKIVVAYRQEYERSKRTLLDLLDSENALFRSQFQLTSVQAVHHFSAHQLLASMGLLLKSLSIAAPAESIADHRTQSQKTFGIFDIDIEPLRK